MPTAVSLFYRMKQGWVSLLSTIKNEKPTRRSDGLDAASQSIVCKAATRTTYDKYGRSDVNHLVSIHKSKTDITLQNAGRIEATRAETASDTHLEGVLADAVQVAQNFHSDAALPRVHRRRRENGLASAAAEVVEYPLYISEIFARFPERTQTGREEIDERCHIPVNIISAWTKVNTSQPWYIGWGNFISAVRRAGVFTQKQNIKRSAVFKATSIIYSCV